MENALYYTLSTIAQTLAGSLGILVAVVLFKLAALGRVIDEGKDELARNSIDATLAWPHLRSGGLDALAAHVKKVLHFDVRERPHVRRAAETAYAADQAWQAINTRLYLTVAATAVDIAMCFLALPFTPHIACSGWTGAVLAIVVGLGVVCLLLYVWLIVAMVRRPAD
jgi:hypothetical protein